MIQKTLFQQDGGSYVSPACSVKELSSEVSFCLSNTGNAGEWEEDEW